jgi:hypothetical protein
MYAENKQNMFNLLPTDKGTTWNMFNLIFGYTYMKDQNKHLLTTYIIFGSTYVKNQNKHQSLIYASQVMCT